MLIREQVMGQGTPRQQTPSQIEERLCSKREAGQMRGQRSPGLTARIEQRLNDERGRLHQVALDQGSWDSQDTIPSPHELPITSRVMSALRVVAGVPVNFDDEGNLAREKITDVISDDDLTPELDAEQSAPAQEAPHERFRMGRGVAHHPGALLEERFAGGTLS